MSTPIDPDTLYTPAALAEVIGRSTRHVRDLCRAGLRHVRSRPDGEGRIVGIWGRDWLDWLRRCEAGGEPVTTADVQPEPTRQPRRVRPRLGVVDPVQEYERAAGRGA